MLCAMPTTPSYEYLTANCPDVRIVRCRLHDDASFLLLATEGALLLVLHPDLTPDEINAAARRVIRYVVDEPRGEALRPIAS